jgi:hypothetical protein
MLKVVEHPLKAHFTSKGGMHLFKNPMILILLIIVSVVLFYLANSYSIVSRMTNIFYPCKQDPTNPFPCHGGYDVTLMIVSGVLALTFIIMLIMHYIKQ